MDPGQVPNTFVSNREREYLSKLCWLLQDAGTFTLRAIFNSIHPGISLKEHLAQTHVQSVLTRLQQQKVLTDHQWSILYPLERGAVSSQYYDSRTLVILLQTICHLSPPYPNGWSSNPLPTDHSLSADVVRLQILFQQIGSLVGVRHEEYPVLWRQIVEVLLRQGGSTVRVKIQRIDKDQLSPDQQSYYIDKVRDIWGAREGMAGAFKHLNGPRPNKAKGSRRKKTSDEYEGLSLEDKVVLTKVYKLLIDNIVADDIIDRLQQGQIIKITDRQEIMALSKNQERMQYILAKIQNSKSPYAFKMLLDALKFKYNKIYEEVSELRRITYKHGVKETRDLEGMCNTALRSNYKHVFSRCCPVSWNENYCIPIREYFIQLEIFDNDGHKVHMENLLPSRGTGSKGQKVVLEGEAGSGKTMLASMLAYQWASEPGFFSEDYRFFLLIDAEALNGNILENIYTQTVSSSTKVTYQEFWTTMEQNAEDVLVLVDGYSSNNSSKELNEIINGTRLKQSSVMVFVSPNTSMSKIVKADYKLFNVGLNPAHIERCLRTYASFINIGSDDFEELLMDLDSWTFGFELCYPFICMLVINVYKYTEQKISKIKNISSLMDFYIKALATQFCKRHHLVIDADGFPEEVDGLIKRCEEASFKAVTTKRTCFSDGDLMGDTVNTDIVKLGVLQRSLTTGLLKGHCSLLTNLMAARHLVKFPLEELDQVIREKNLLRYTKYSDLVAFLCGLHLSGRNYLLLEHIFREMLKAKEFQKNVFIEKFDEDGFISTPTHLVKMNHILQSLIECPNAKVRNREKSNSVLVNEDKQDKEKADDEDKKSDTAESSRSSQEDAVQNINDFSEPVCSAVADNFPRTISINKRGLYPITSLLGLCHVLEEGKANIVQLEMAMQSYYMPQEHIYKSLASAFSECSSLRKIRATWSTLDMMPKFLATATKNRQAYSLIHVEAHGSIKSEEFSPIALDDLQSFCENLENTRKLVFTKCPVAIITGHLVQYLPKTISELDLSNSYLNLPSAAELASYIEHSTKLRVLNLHHTGLEGSSLVALSHGLKLSRTLEELVLTDQHFDRSGFWGLCQALRLMTTIELLDLENCALTSEMCSFLLSSLSENKSLRKILISDASVSEQDKKILKYQDENKHLTVLFTGAVQIK